MGNSKLEYFTDNQIALQAEVRLHSVLVERLQNHPVAEYEIRLAEIASYCDVVLHGDYTQKDLSDICRVLAEKLRVKRIGLAFPKDASLVDIVDEPEIIH